VQVPSWFVSLVIAMVLGGVWNDVERWCVAKHCLLWRIDQYLFGWLY
jgi:hypothetical protein